MEQEATSGVLTALAPIHAYDQRTGSDLARTLRVYVECGSLAETPTGRQRHPLTAIRTIMSQRALAREGAGHEAQGCRP